MFKTKMENSKKIEIKVREIVFSGEEDKSFCDVFVYEPENIDEQMLGNLYIIGEVVNLSESSSYLVNLLASIIKKEFYLNTKRTVIEALEASLHKANAILSDLAEQGNVDWVGNLNMICAVYSKNELHLSQAGEVKTLLMRNGQITDIGKNITKEERTHPFKTFANIASGELEVDDLALFATPKFFNIFSLEKLKKMSTALQIDEFAEKLQETIEQEDKVSTIGALIMKIQEERKKDELPHLEINTAIYEERRKEEASSILQRESQKTDEKIKQWAEEGAEDKENYSSSVNEGKVSLENIIQEYEKVEKENGGEKTQKEEAVFSENGEDARDVLESESVFKNQNGENIQGVLDEAKEDEVETGIKKILKNTFSVLSKILRSVLNFVKIKIISPAVLFVKRGASKNEEGEKAETESSRFVNLVPVKNKFLLITFMIVAVVLLGNVIFTKYQEEEEDKLVFYQEMLFQADSKMDEVEGAIIYGDFAEARILLTAAKNLTLEVKNDYQKLDSEANNLLAEIQVQFDKVDLVKRIEDPKIAVDLVRGGEIKNAGGIIKIDEVDYVFDSFNNSLHQINFADQKAIAIQIASGDSFSKFKLSTAMAKTGEIIFLTETNELVVFDLNKKELNSKEIKFSSGVSDVKGLASFSSFLYSLEPDANQIYKHSGTTAGFAEGKIWIKDPEADLRNAVSLAIDGSIYVLKSGGSVDKYLSGSKFKLSDGSDFVIDQLSDPLDEPTEIYTRADLKYLYISDPQKNRIAIFDKNSGKLIGQYISEKFSGLKNVIVNDQEEKIYALSGDWIFEIGIGEIGIGE